MKHLPSKAYVYCGSYVLNNQQQHAWLLLYLYTDQHVLQLNQKCSDGAEDLQHNGNQRRKWG